MGKAPQHGSAGRVSAGLVIGHHVRVTVDPVPDFDLGEAHLVSPLAKAFPNPLR